MLFTLKNNMKISDCYISFLNLDSRPDRLEHMNNQLAVAGITAERTRGKHFSEYDLNNRKVQVMKNRTAGAIGCHFGQVEIMRTAQLSNKHAFVMEDDLIFCSDIQKRFEVIENFLSNNEWDIFWLGGTYHVPAEWHKHGHNSDLQMCGCDLGIDAERTDNNHIVRTYGCFSTFAYIVNKNSLEKILTLLDENLHLSMGIDWLFILLQPQLKTFAFVPGCVKQMDNRSDIGNGITYFSQFAKLGEHWYQEEMGMFDAERLFKQ